MEGAFASDFYSYSVVTLLKQTEKCIHQVLNILLNKNHKHLIFGIFIIDTILGSVALKNQQSIYKANKIFFNSYIALSMTNIF